jgi:RHS repeat-associated protein
MSGISSKAAGKLENKKGFNGNELQNKEFSDGSGLELYDFNARTYDQEIGRFIQIDPTPDDGDQESLTPYHFSGNNPSTFNDPNGKCPWCDEIKEGLKAAVTATVATVAVAVDNVLGTNVTGSIANSGDVPTTQINNWNTAVTSANNASVVVGTGATIVGGGIATGSAATTIGSGGTTAIVTAPAFVVGVATAAVGAVVTANASKNLAEKKGLIRDQNAPPGTYDKKPSATKDKNRVVDQKPGEAALNQSEGLNAAKDGAAKNKPPGQKKQTKINENKKTEDKLKTELKKTKTLDGAKENF